MGAAEKGSGSNGPTAELGTALGTAELSLRLKCGRRNWGRRKSERRKWGHAQPLPVISLKNTFVVSKRTESSPYQDREECRPQLQRPPQRQLRCQLRCQRFHWQSSPIQRPCIASVHWIVRWKTDPYPFLTDSVSHPGFERASSLFAMGTESPSFRSVGTDSWRHFPYSAASSSCVLSFLARSSSVSCSLASRTSLHMRRDRCRCGILPLCQDLDGRSYRARGIVALILPKRY